VILPSSTFQPRLGNIRSLMYAMPMRLTNLILSWYTYLPTHQTIQILNYTYTPHRLN